MFPEERSLVKEMQGRPFVLLGVNAGDKLERAQESVKKNKLNWRSFFDGNSRRITGLFNVRAFPTVMIIDHTGKIAHSNLRGAKLIPEIKRLVKEAEGDGMVGEKQEPKMRTFRNSTGEHRVEAIAVAMSGGEVQLRKKDGEMVTMALEDLSRTDQAYLKQVDVPAIGGTAASNTTSQTGDSDNKFRIFVDSTGQHKTEAQFVKLVDGKVTLLKKDGESTTLPLDRLSDADQAFVKQQAGDGN